MTTNNLNVSPEQIQQYLPLFTKMPDTFWDTVTALWVHYLDKGIGSEQAVNSAMNDLILGLPTIQRFVGNFNFAGGIQGQTRVA